MVHGHAQSCRNRIHTNIALVGYSPCTDATELSTEVLQKPNRVPFRPTSWPSDGFAARAPVPAADWDGPSRSSLSRWPAGRRSGWGVRACRYLVPVTIPRPTRALVPSGKMAARRRLPASMWLTLLLCQAICPRPVTRWDLQLRTGSRDYYRDALQKAPFRTRMSGRWMSLFCETRLDADSWGCGPGEYRIPSCRDVCWG